MKASCLLWQIDWEILVLVIVLFFFPQKNNWLAAIIIFTMNWSADNLECNKNTHYEFAEPKPMSSDVKFPKNKNKTE